MDIETFFLLATVGTVIALAVTVALLLVWFLLYSQFLASRLIYYSLDVIDPALPIYTAWFLGGITDVGGFIVTSFSTLRGRFVDNVIPRLPLLLGLIILSFGAMVATEYHDSGAEIAMNVYQCFVRWIFYDLSILRLLNIARVLYDILWPFTRFTAELTRYATSTWIFEGLLCSKDEIFTGLGRVGTGLLLVVEEVANYVAAVTSLDAEALPDFTFAYETITRGVVDAVLRVGDCLCSQIDFIFIILFQWIKSAPAVSLLNHSSQLGIAVVRIIPRTITATNPGTIPGTTANYGYVPSLEFIFDILCLMLNDAADLINYELFVIVSEIVGKADPTLFVPGSPEAVVLAYDWFGFLGHVGCAAVNAGRWIYRVLWSIVLLIVAAFAQNADATSPDDINPAVPIFCDVREWRALYDFGGLTGTMYKPNGGIEGELQIAFDHLDFLFNAASPIARKLIVPILRSASTLAFGTLNFIARFIFHAFDSEFRMFSPVFPPRTSIPVSAWTPPTALPPDPIIDCGNFVAERGYVWVWIQHYVNDPHGSVLRFVDVHATEWTEGWKELASLAEPDFGLFLEQLFLFVFYAVDFVIQSIAHINVTFEGLADYTLFITIWRYARFFDTFKFVGEGLQGTFERIHSEIPPGTPCVDPEDGLFCALGAVFGAGIRLVDSVLDQIVYFFVQARLVDFEMPNFIMGINDLVEAADALAVLVAFLVPPIPIKGNPLTLYVQRVLSALVYAASFVLYFPNYIIASFQTVVDVFKVGGTATTISTAVGTWFGQILDYFIVEFIKRFCGEAPDPEGLFFAVAFMFDTFVLGAVPGDGIWTTLVTALCTILSGLADIFSDFAIEVLAAVFNVVGAFFNLFFGSNGNFGSRLEALVKAIVDLFFNALPGLLLDLALGLIELIPVIGPILAAVARALIGGLCQTLQGFFNVIVDVLNFFGANLALVNLGCPSKKRGLTEEEPDFSPVASLILNAMRHTNATSSLKSHRYAKLRELGRRIGAAQHRLKRTRSDPSVEDLEAGLRNAPNASISVSMQEALQMITQYAEWSGESFCDKIVLEFGRHSPDDLSFVERSHYEDCVSKRAIGELIGVMPGMQWFPSDGLYNTFAWLKLGVDAVRVLQLYQQHNEDRSMPTEVVLSDAYKARWEKMGLRTDHLTEDNYDYVIENMTLTDYFERNDANMDLLDAALDTYHIVINSGVRYSEFFADIAQTSNSTRQQTEAGISENLESWLYAAGVGDDGPPSSTPHRRHHKLPRQVEMKQNVWRSLLRLGLIGLNGTVTATRLVYETDLPRKAMAAASTIPGAAYSVMKWAGSGSTPEWEEILRQRQENMRAHGFNAPIWGRMRPGALFEQFWAWGRGRVSAAASHLRPNDARARRNWMVILQFFYDFRRAAMTGWLPNRETLLRPYTPRYPTGEFTIDPETGETVGVLAACDTTLVPFCLDCAILDGLFAATVEAALRFENYWQTLWQDAIDDYTNVENYLSDTTINVCDGDGTQPIHWPSDIVLTGNTTVVDVFGDANGAIAGFIAFAANLLFDELGALRFGKEDVYAKVRHAFYLDRPGRSERQAGLVSGADRSLPQRRLAVNYITNYAQSHTEFDPTYALTQFFDITVITEVLDDASNFFVGIDFSFANESNPFLGNDTVDIPQLQPDIGDEFGFFSRFVQDIVAIDYDHNCERDRNMTLLQGIILFAILGLILFLLILGLRECIPETLVVMAGLTTVLLVVGVLFLVVVYGVPVQNQFGLPAVLPHCLAKDVVNTAVCDIIPKCPAVVAGLVIGEYSEANCRTCPFEPVFGNCKRDFDVRHGFDVILLLLEWLSRPLMSTLRNESGLGIILVPIFGLVGIDPSRYANIDFSDKVLFDRSFICIILIGLFTIPVTALALQISTLILSPLLEVGSGLVSRLFNVVTSGVLIFGAIVRTLHVNLIQVSTPLELRDFRRDVQQDGGRSRQSSTFSEQTVGIGSAVRSMTERADLLFGVSDAWHGREERVIAESGQQLRKRARKRKRPKADIERPRVVDKKHD